MDFYYRKEIYLFVAIFLIILIPIIYLILITTSPGLEIDANLELQNSPMIVIHFNNTSSHTIDNISVYLNNEIVKEIVKLDANSSLILELPALIEKLDLRIDADNYSGFEKSFTLDKSAINKTQLKFKPEYIFNKAGSISDLSLEICNDSENTDLHIDLVLDDGELKKGNINEIRSIELNKCITLQYSILYNSKGDKKIKFKIYNDVYNKELQISGNVN